MRQLQGMDSSFVAMESPNSPMHIGSVLIYNPETAPGGFVRFKDILDFIENRLRLSTTMRQRLVRVPFDLDFPYWVEDPNFDLEYHVRHVALPKPGDWRQLCIQAARIHARPLDRDRPERQVVHVLEIRDCILKCKCYNAARFKRELRTVSDFLPLLHRNTLSRLKLQSLRESR